MIVSDMTDCNIIDDGHIYEWNSDGGAPLMSPACFFSPIQLDLKSHFDIEASIMHFVASLAWTRNVSELS